MNPYQSKAFPRLSQIPEFGEQRNNGFSNFPSAPTMPNWPTGANAPSQPTFPNWPSPPTQGVPQGVPQQALDNWSAMRARIPQQALNNTSFTQFPGLMRNAVRNVSMHPSEMRAQRFLELVDRFRNRQRWGRGYDTMIQNLTGRVPWL